VARIVVCQSVCLYVTDVYDLDGQYCNRNCIGCSASFLATAGLLVVAFRCKPTCSRHFFQIRRPIMDTVFKTRSYISFVQEVAFFYANAFDLSFLMVFCMVFMFACHLYSIHAETILVAII